MLGGLQCWVGFGWQWDLGGGGLLGGQWMELRQAGRGGECGLQECGWR